MSAASSDRRPPGDDLLREMQILANADHSEMRIFIGDTEDQLRQRPEYVEG